MLVFPILRDTCLQDAGDNKQKMLAACHGVFTPAFPFNDILRPEELPDAVI